MLKRCTAGGVAVDIVDDVTIRTFVSREDLVSIKNKEDVFEGLAHFTTIFERNNETNLNERELYSKCSVNERPLEAYRIEDRTPKEDAKAKETLIKGLISTLFLVSDGKVYDVLLNPLNFVYDKKKKKVKAFLRKDTALAEITDDWLYNVKKLIAYFLVNDSGLMPEQFDELTLDEIENKMMGNVLAGFKQLRDARSVGEMAELMLDDSELKPLINYPPIIKPYVVPKDITTEDGAVEKPVDDNEELGLDSTKEEGKGQKKKKPVKEKGEKGNGGVAKIVLAFVIGTVAGLLVNKFILPGLFGVVDLQTVTTGWWS